MVMSGLLLLAVCVCAGTVSEPLWPAIARPGSPPSLFFPTPTPDTIRYDDGAGTAYYNASDWYFAVMFTPIVPCTLRGASVSNYQTSSDSCTLFVWANAGGEPGALLHDPLTFLGLSNFFRQVDLDSAVYVDTDFWIGYSAPGPPFCLMDAAPSSPVRSFYSISGLTWTEINAGDLLLRALVDYGDVVIRDINLRSLRATGGFFMRNPTSTVPSAIVENLGDSTESAFPVECLIMDTTYTTSIIYADTQYAGQVAPGALDTVQFEAWAASVDGEYILRATALLSGDMVSDNDRMYLETQISSPPRAALTYDDNEFDGSFTGVPGHAWATEYKPPWYPCLVESVKVYFGTSGDPAIIWVMDDDGPWRNPGTVWYAETTSVSSSGWHTFDTYLKAPVFDDGVFYVVYWYMTGAPSLGYDSDLPIASQTWRFTGSWGHDKTNDWLMQAYVSLVERHDAVVVDILAPSDTVLSDSTYDVGALIANLGNLPDTIVAYCSIDGYSDTLQLPDVGYGQTAQAWFDQWIVPHSDTFAQTTMTVHVSVPGDLNPLNDTLARTIVYGPPVGIAESTREKRSASPALGQNNPNPFSTCTQIRLSIPARAEKISLLIYDSAGRLVKMIPLQAAEVDVTVTWDGRTESGRRAGPGLYFYKLDRGSALSARKMVLLR